MRHIVDLSHVIEHGMQTYPGLPAPVISDHLGFDDSRSHYAEGTEFHIGAIEMVANTGTYLDVPSHRYRDGYDLTALPLERIVDVPVVVVDATAAEAIGAGVLEGAAVDGRAVLIHTGWDRYWRTQRYGAGGHPHLAADLVDALVGAGPALVGIDSINVDSTEGAERTAHSKLLAAGIPIIEHLTRLGQLPCDRDVRLTVLPAAVRGLGSFPVRPVCYWDD